MKAIRLFNQSTGEHLWSVGGAIVTDPVVIAEIEAECLKECERAATFSETLQAILAKPDPISTHIIEGCIEVDGEKVSAFTVVDDTGAPLFEPKPLSELGFTECC